MKPGKQTHAWLTRDADLGNSKNSRVCRRTQLVRRSGSAATESVIQNVRKKLAGSTSSPPRSVRSILGVILDTQKHVNTENPRDIAGLKCFQCKAVIDNLRSLKRHDWAYAKPALLKILQQMEERGPSR